MPIYVFRCKRLHTEEKFLPMDERDVPQKCGMCHRKTERQFSALGITGEFMSQQMLEVEREKWALATGQNHKTPAELSAWCEANGKSIVAPGWKPKVDHTPEDHEIEKAVDEIYRTNHSLGEVRT